jgi:hypothetical protein
MQMYEELDACLHHCWPLHWIQMRAQLHAPSAFPLGKQSSVLRGLRSRKPRAGANVSRRWEDDQQTGRPRTVRPELKTKEFATLVPINRSETVHEVAPAAGINRGTCHRILSDDLNMSRVTQRVLTRRPHENACWPDRQCSKKAPMANTFREDVEMRKCTHLVIRCEKNHTPPAAETHHTTIRNSKTHTSREETGGKRNTTHRKIKT